MLEHHNRSLENHVAFLEQTIREYRPDLDLGTLRRNTVPASIPTEIADPISVSPVVSFQERPPSRNDICKNSNNDRAMEDPSNLELLCLRSAGADPHYFGASSAYSFTKMFSASLRAVRRQAPGLSMSGVMDESCESRPHVIPAPLPNRAVVNLLTSAYFEQVHPQFPFLHRMTYLQWEEEVLNDSEAGISPNPVHLFFVYAVSPLLPMVMNFSDERSCVQ